ncbi:MULTISPECIES: alginate lyase family protein [unclassified Agarivorans]|uniref:alginate lyase family protein n=2 Tax=Agarivorans TaxID=261825 RepID=UPI0026E20A92|nr:MULTISPECIES: alginate lyase family protein [unclassified Agarivorans]MDO6764094.1 alginate lyase family protein [Agarivorans sp. 1_MG-2023]
MMTNYKPLALAVCFAFSSSALAAEFVFVNESVLKENRALLHSDAAPASMKLSYERLLEEAGYATKAGPFSVTDKGMTPPSGDKNDYLSISPYWWPDKNKADGLPWIRHDGKVNPASKTSETDSKRLGKFTRSVRALAIAYYFSQDEKYAETAIDYIRTWFLNPETRMNPNMNFAQGVPGRADGRRSGLIDSRSFADRMLDAVAMVSTSPNWTEADEKGINQWYSEYLNWLLTSELGGGPKGEAYAENNHGSWYDLQVAGISYFLGKESVAMNIVEKGKMRIDTQFMPDGTQPHELGRTRSYHYSYFNLDALAGVAQVGEKIGIDLWSYQSTTGASLKKGIDLVAQYHDNAEGWPYQHKKTPRTMRMIPIYRKAGLGMSDESLLALSKSGDFSKYTVKKNLAEIWAERDIELLYPRK